MKTALEKIYYDEVEAQNIPDTKEWIRLYNKQHAIYEVFYASLTEEQKKQCDEMSKYKSEMECEVMLQYYKEGFKFGLKVGAEAFLQ